jgi:hypothetical protein
MDKENSESSKKQQAMLFGRYSTPRLVYQAKWTSAFWWAGSIVSLFINAVLISVVFLLWGQIQHLQTLQATSMQLLNEVIASAYFDLILLEDANIQTTVTVQDTIPVQFDLNVKTDTNVILTDDTYLPNARIDLLTGGLNIINAPTDILLPEGTELPIALDIVVPVDKTVSVNLIVPVDIELKKTKLGEPFQRLQELLWPYLTPADQQFLCNEGRGFECSENPSAQPE